MISLPDLDCILCVLCCFIVLCDGTFSVLLYYFLCFCILSLCYCILLFLLYIVIYCSVLFFLLCMCTCLYILYLTLPPGVNPVAVSKYLSIYKHAAIPMRLLPHPVKPQTGNASVQNLSHNSRVGIGCREIGVEMWRLPVCHL
jgi:hypothetical protein